MYHLTQKIHLCSFLTFYPRRATGIFFGIFFLVALLSSVCSAAEPTEPSVLAKEKNTAKNTAKNIASAGTKVDAKVILQDSWDVMMIKEAKIGFAHTTVHEITEANRKLVHYQSDVQMKMKRFGEVVVMKFELSSIETPRGQMLRFKNKILMGPNPVVVEGKLVEGKMVITTTARGKSLSTTIDWPKDTLGYQAMEMSLRHKPLKPGEKRTLRGLAPMINQVVTFELLAKDYEQLKLLSGTFKLLRIDASMVLPNGQKMPQVFWTDRDGEVLKTLDPSMNIESFRATKQIATAEAEAIDFDLGSATIVKLKRAIPKAHTNQQVRYLVKLKRTKPSEAFATGPTQSLKSTGETTAELTVRALRPASPLAWPDAKAAKPEAGPKDEDREPNSLVQSDDPRIVAMAREAAGDETDPWPLAVRLEKYVQVKITEKNYSQVFASAAEVAETLEGDCTEHSVLLAALARARKLPARVAMGLVYAPSLQSFAYHMWTEVYVKDRWIPLDGTLGQGGIGAAHLKIAHSSLKGASAYSSLLPVMQVIGQLEIEVLEVK